MIKLPHKKPIIFFCQLFLIATLIIACHQTTIHTSTNTCTPNYNPNQDYFPNKIKITHARGLAVEYHKHYKVVTIKNPWQNAKTQFQYVLVQCGTPTPQGFKQAQVITVPIHSIVSLSTTHLPHLAKLGVVDKLIGISNSKQVNTPDVVERIKAGKITQVGNNSNVDIERLLELNPDLVTTFGTGNSQTDSYSKLTEAGLKVGINAEYMEDTPLGRSEWLKFTALFFNQEEKAEKIFAEITDKYEQVAQKVKSVKNRPTVFVGFNFKGTWFMPGGNSYVAKYLADAGGDYLWSNEQSAGSLPLSFEVVLERATNADYWLNFSQSWQSLKDLLAEDNRYADFKSVKIGNLYNNNARVNESGGNDYWEGGISNPDIVLSDLIRILHPEILPNHQLFYYHKILK
ncbi:ABC transporter substrate-binding protein [Anabaena sp. FACHB-709]|uniref:ABC transporter, periplasmic-binding protein n=2 Tax=Nostocaceae TaxID=1162 RepID=A0A1Z4KL30_ANAVA|nr:MULTISPECIES: ABC transporter substrate-binding protein [Nostocaceae]BAY69658.1 ABC transporter, periplasmic-binding protein [Trichormus variabilis NIES-23]HBW32391.1 ABC transporter substrate-binding protein [Nostoc sp. UBA8866]MBD2173690.1 ABC transporter substrate-binding protein [Anabaena cylindrica FACHB-318]MBD2265432.1 ABC transporter substrate-binding protein [Anabaena sp. FACHB-709]MBD2274644.1 ABC transporter substrate-binding protein [Nostoc sp. PCC 7120 = FACHB-418]